MKWFLLAFYFLFAPGFAFAIDLSTYTSGVEMNIDADHQELSCEWLKKEVDASSDAVSELRDATQELFDLVRQRPASSRLKRIERLKEKIATTTEELHQSSIAFKEAERVDRELRFDWRLPASLRFAAVGSDLGFTTEAIKLPAASWNTNLGVDPSQLIGLTQQPELIGASIQMRARLSGVQACLLRSPVDVDLSFRSEQQAGHLHLTSRSKRAAREESRASERELAETLAMPVIEAALRPLEKGKRPCGELLTMFSPEEAISSTIPGIDTAEEIERFRTGFVTKMWAYLRSFAYNNGHFLLNRAEIEQESPAWRRTHMKFAFTQNCREPRLFSECAEARLEVRIPLSKTLSLENDENWAVFFLKNDPVRGVQIEDFNVKGLSYVATAAREVQGNSQNEVEAEMDDFMARQCWNHKGVMQ